MSVHPIIIGLSHWIKLRGNWYSIILFLLLKIWFIYVVLLTNENFRFWNNYNEVFHVKALKDLLFVSNQVTPTPTQHYLVWNRLQRKISFVTSFTISKWLKKYYYHARLLVDWSIYNSLIFQQMHKVWLSNFVKFMASHFIPKIMQS